MVSVYIINALIIFPGVVTIAYHIVDLVSSLAQLVDTASADSASTGCCDQRPDNLPSHLRSPWRNVCRLDHCDLGPDSLLERGVKHRLSCSCHTGSVRVCSRPR